MREAAGSYLSQGCKPAPAFLQPQPVDPHWGPGVVVATPCMVALVQAGVVQCQVGRLNTSSMGLVAWRKHRFPFLPRATLLRRSSGPSKSRET